MPSSNNGKRVVTSNRGTNRTNMNHDFEFRFQQLEGEVKLLNSQNSKKDDEIKSLKTGLQSANAKIENLHTKY